MKKILLSLVFASIVFNGYAVNYYSQATGNLENTTVWGTLTTGFGTPPVNFTTPGDVFFIRNRTTAAIGSGWTVSGAGSKIVLGDLTLAAISFSIGGSANLTTSGGAVIEIPNALTGSNTLTINQSTVPGLGALGTGSTVNFAGFNIVPNTTYGNVTISSNATLAITANTAIMGVLSIPTNATFTMPAGAIFVLTTLGTTIGTASGRLLIENYNPSPVPTGVTYNFNVEYNSTAAQNIMAGTYNQDLAISGARGATNVTCQSGGTFTLNNNFIYTATFGTGTFIPSGSTFNYNGAGVQTVAAVPYTNLSFNNNGIKTLPNGTANIAGSLTINNNATFATTNTATLIGAFTTFTDNALTSILRIGSIAATPVPAGKIYAFSVSYNAGGNQTVFPGTYSNLIIEGSGTKTHDASAGSSISGILTINDNCTFSLPTGANLTGSFTNVNSNTANSTLFITNTSPTPVPAGLIYNSIVEYNGSSLQTMIPGTFNQTLRLSGSRGANNVNCVPLGIYNITMVNPSNPGPFNNASSWGTGSIITNTSTFNYSGAGAQFIQVNNIVYNNLTFSNSGNKTGATFPVRGVLSVEGAAITDTPASYQTTGSLQYKNAGTRNRMDTPWPRESQAPLTNPINIIIDNTTINITDLKTAPVAFPGTRLLTTNLEIKNNGLLDVNTNCRLDLFRNFLVNSGGQLTGQLGSLIHISGGDPQSIGAITTLGELNYDKTIGTATITGNQNAGIMRMWDPSGSGTGGTYNYTGTSVATVTGSTSLEKGTLCLNSANLTPVKTHNFGSVSISGTALMDISSANFTRPANSVNVNVSGNFLNTATVGGGVNTIGTGSFGEIYFSGTTQNLQSLTSTRASYFVNLGSTTTLVGPVNLETTPTSARGSFTVLNGGKLMCGINVISGGNAFNLNPGSTIGVGSPQGINDNNASFGNILTNTKVFSSAANYEYNGTAAQNTGIFNTSPTLLNVNNLTINNTSGSIDGVTAQQDFIVNGIFTATAGKFTIRQRSLTIEGNIANSGTGVIKGHNTPVATVPNTELYILGTGAIAGPLRFDQTTPGVSNFVTAFTYNRIGTSVLSLGSDFGARETFSLAGNKGGSTPAVDGRICVLNIGSNTLNINGATAFPNPNQCLRGSASSRLIFATNPDYASDTRFYMDQSAPGVSNLLQDLTINRPAAAMVLLAPNGSYGNPVIVGNSVTITSGFLTLNTNELTINGTLNCAATLPPNPTGYIRSRASGATLSRLNIAGSGSLGGSIFMDNTGLSTTAGVSRGSNAADDLTVLTPGVANNLDRFTFNRPGQTITLGNEMQISGTVVPTAGILATGTAGSAISNLVMLSTATVTSSILAFPASGASISGNVNVQSYFTGGGYLVGRGFRMISSPIVEVALGNNFIQRMKQRFIVTGRTGIAGSFDAGGTKQPNAITFRSYVETGAIGSASYNSPASISEAINIGQGYFFFFRGNRSNATTTKVNDTNLAFANPENWTATYIGNINFGDKQINVTVTGTDGFQGYNLLGNPYPATLDFDLFQAGNSGVLSNTLSIIRRDRQGYLTRSNGIVNYAPTLIGTPSGTPPDSIRYIQPGQGFFVKAIINNGTVTFREAHKASSANQAKTARVLSVPNRNGVRIMEARSKTILSTPVVRQLIRLSVSDESNVDAATVVLEAGNESTFGGDDASYFGGNTVSCSTLSSDGFGTAINFMPAVDEVDSIRIVANSVASNPDLKLNFFETTAIAGRYAVLEDKYLNTFTPIDGTNSSYSFGIDKNIGETFGKDRFVLLLKEKGTLPIRLTDFSAKRQNLGNFLSWRTSSERNAGRFDIERGSDDRNFSKIGEVAAVGESGIAANYAFLDENPIKGMNYYRLKMIDKDGSTDYSAVRAVDFDMVNSGELNIYPNPVLDVLNVGWKSKTTVANKITIYDMNGREVEVYGAGPGQAFRQDVSGLANGAYVLKVRETKSGKLIGTGKFVKGDR